MIYLSRISYNMFYFSLLLQVSCRANIYDLYDETVDKIIEEERVNALFPSKSPVGEQNYVLQQHPYDQSTLSQYTSYSDNNNAHNQNDAQIQGELENKHINV